MLGRMLAAAGAVTRPPVTSARQDAPLSNGIPGIYFAP